MQQFISSFILTLVSSLWQAGILFLVYKLTEIAWLKKALPASRKNFLLLLVMAQLVISVITFAGFYNSNSVWALDSTWVMQQFDNTGILYNISVVLMTLYTAVLLLKTVQIIFGWLRFKDTWHSALVKPPVDIRLFTSHTSSILGIKRKVRIWLSEHISSPVTFGFLKPVILLPVSLVNQISQQQAETIILHELSHIKANDYLVNWLVLFAETVFFFNPFITKACSQYKLEREKNCDINVINFNYPVVVYAESLLAVAKAKPNATLLFAAENNETLFRRIQYFSSVPSVEENKAAKWVSALIVSGAAVILSLLNITSKNQTALNPINNINIPVIPIQSSFASLPEVTASVTKKPVKEIIKADNLNNSAEKPVLYKKADAETVSVTRTTAPSPALYNIYPVAQPETIAEQEILVEEETSGVNGKSLSVYKLKFDGNNWILEPVIKLNAKEKRSDSSIILKDTLKTAY